MSLTILYHNPARPDEACMTMVLGQETAGPTIDQLEDQGFLIDKITLDPSAAAQAESPGISRSLGGSVG